MNKKIVIMVIIPILGFVAFDWITGFSDQNEIINEDIFHITLADPELYANGVYTDKF